MVRVRIRVRDRNKDRGRAGREIGCRLGLQFNLPVVVDSEDD